MTAAAALSRVLELGRWAPSGDNTQPWRFEIVDDRHVVVHGRDTRAHCVYDLDGHPSQMSIGALLETLAIAASAEGWRLDASRRGDMPETLPTFDVAFTPDAGVLPDPLLPSVPHRSVQRRALSRRRLTGDEKAALEAAVGSGYRIVWLDGAASLRRAARLMFDNARMRLTMPEAFQVHRDVIEWNARYSADRVPDQALGVDPMTARLMRFVMRSWTRVSFFNRWLAGTWAPRLQMDVAPSLACAAHFLIVARMPMAGVDDHVAAGRALQRFWLTATHHGLQLQPEMTPVIFARYARERVRFSATPGMSEAAGRLARRLADWVGDDTLRATAFMGRIGAGSVARSRSLRRPIAELLVPASPRRAADDEAPSLQAVSHGTVP